MQLNGGGGRGRVFEQQCKEVRRFHDGRGQPNKPPQLDTVAELEAFLEATDIYTSRLISFVCSDFKPSTRHRSRVRSLPRSLRHLHIKAYLFFLFGLQTFTTRHRSQVRSFPRSYRHLHINAYLFFWFGLQTFTTRHRRLVRSFPRSYRHLHIKAHLVFLFGLQTFNSTP